MEETMQELNLDQKVTVRSIAGWPTTFSRLVDGYGGDIIIAPNGTTRISRGEIIAQIQNGNKLFTGIDGMGSHATLFVDDAPTRREAGFESEDGKRPQDVLTDEKMKKLFELKTFKTFKERFVEVIVTRAEKYTAMEMIRKAKFNDFDKINFAQQHTGFKY